jgi:hypothetical protein
MDDHERAVGRSGPAILFVYPDNHAVGEAAAEGLRAAGRETVRAESVYAAVVALAAEPGHFAAAILAIDFFNREELRFFPMAKRRWPALTTVALTEPAFAYKAAIADLAGADFILCDAARAGELVERLIPAEKLSENGSARVPHLGPAGFFAGQGVASEKKETGQEEETVAERPRRWPRKQSEPAAEAAVVRRPLGELPKKPARPLTTQEILTEEELAALMENMEEDDLPNE